MIIDRIVLNNIGSYEGEVAFDTRPNGKRNIVVIGGKNGAGKTTLFTAIRLCLYGFLCMGYKTNNAYYQREIIKLINNTAKLKRPTNSSIRLFLEINNGHDNDLYILTRSWVYDGGAVESFSVSKNATELSKEEVADFEQYLLSIIPPELFNLYFFDGEKIADFFLTEGSNSRMKDAFLTVCGYDVFDIMRKNFRRIKTSSTDPTDAFRTYVDAKDAVSTLEQRIEELNDQLRINAESIENNEAEIAALDTEYQKKGGLTQEEWDQRVARIKEEEKKRETWNGLLKKWANETIPFLMLRTEIGELIHQIEDENKSIKYKNFLEILESPEVKSIIGPHYQSIVDVASKKVNASPESILDLSVEQSSLLLSQARQVLSFDVDKIKKCKLAIKRSITVSGRIRKELDNSSISSAQEYLKTRMDLVDHKGKLLVEKTEIEKELEIQTEKQVAAQNDYIKAKIQLEEGIKKASISDISTKAILMLDQLQGELYRDQVGVVEDAFRYIIKVLLRKENFINDIRIDDQFNVHIYRSETQPGYRMLELLKDNSEEQLTALIGKRALKMLQTKHQIYNYQELQDYYLQHSDAEETFSVEIDKESLSNGEKQIFIMALYFSLVSLSNQTIPFIIDTPFARIDTEHRANISKDFFCRLKSQVFILSTNEEIDTSHMRIMKDRIAATFLLENNDNQRTVVTNNEYFGENI